MKIKIKVTKEILFRSADCNSVSDPHIRTSCAFALAVRELFPNAQVYQFTTNLLGGTGLADQIRNPDLMTLFIKKFDFATPLERINMPETEVEIDVHDKIIDAIGLSEVYRILSESKTLELAAEFNAM